MDGVVLAAGAPRHGSWLDIGLLFAAFMVPLGAFFVATGHSRRLHQWIWHRHNAGRQSKPVGS